MILIYSLEKLRFRKMPAMFCIPFKVHNIRRNEVIRSKLLYAKYEVRVC